MPDPCAIIAVYRCPEHGITTLVVESLGGNGTSFHSTRCCRVQYERVVRKWLLNASDVEGFCEELQNRLKSPDA